MILLKLQVGSTSYKHHLHCEMLVIYNLLNPQAAVTALLDIYWLQCLACSIAYSVFCIVLVFVLFCHGNNLLLLWQSRKQAGLLYIPSSCLLCTAWTRMPTGESEKIQTQDSSWFDSNERLSRADPFSQNLLLSANSPQSLTSDNSTFSDIPPCALTPDHEELVTIEAVEYQQEEVSGGMENDPLSDSGYIELHYYETQQYLVLPGDTQLDLETVEILQLDAEAQEAAGSLLDLAGGGY